MSIQEDLASVKNFSIENSLMSFWIIKRKSTGAFSAKSVAINDGLKGKIRETATESLREITEIEGYTLLAQNTEANCLHVDMDETTFHSIRQIIDEPPEENIITKISDITGGIAYVVRLWDEDTGTSLYCVKKIGSDWVAKKKKGLSSLIYEENILKIIEEPTFVLYGNFDFFVHSEAIFIRKKQSFESVLSYKVEYTNSFDLLKDDPVFSGIFSEIETISNFIGNNAMHLRRMAVIKEKGHYASLEYMNRLKEKNEEKNWGITFDAEGRIVASLETMRVIMQVLLNHRLFSELSHDTFDVPTTTATV